MRSNVFHVISSSTDIDLPLRLFNSLCIVSTAAMEYDDKPVHNARSLGAQRLSADTASCMKVHHQ